jgi:hypothetical protein
MAAHGCVWLRVAAYGCAWLRMAAYGCVWQRMAAHGFVWLRTANDSVVLATFADSIFLQGNPCKYLFSRMPQTNSSPHLIQIYLCNTNNAFQHLSK